VGPLLAYDRLCLCNFFLSLTYYDTFSRYFNRVHTGFEWNKYNQTHYDFDNPPPKIVQGYKFNIFYPDLIDKGLTPQFTLIPTDNGDFCILKITSGKILTIKFSE
jgi:hypothetical protein